MQVTCRGCGVRAEWAEGVARRMLCPQCNGFSFKAPPPLRIECGVCGVVVTTDNKNFEFMHCRQRTGIPLHALGSMPVVERAKEVVKETVDKVVKSKRTKMKGNQVQEDEDNNNKE